MKSKKADFPILKQKVNGNLLTYLDSAATSQKPQVVIDALSEYYKKYNSNVRRALYPIAERATEEVENVREVVAHFLNARSRNEIVFVRNTTEAINLVASGLTYAISKNDTITTTILEHHSNFVPWQMLAGRTGAWFEVLDVDEKYNLTLPDFSKTAILAITHVSNVLGTINNIKKIIKKARKENPEIIVIVDAAQSVPHMQVDVRDLDCDFLAFSGHKTYAGMGVGVLYGKSKRLETLSPFLFGGEMIDEVHIEKTTFQKPPFKFEAGTPAVSDIITLGTAIEYMQKIGIKNIHEFEVQLVEYAFERLSERSEVKIIGPQDPSKRSTVLSFVLDGIHAHDVAQILGDMGVCIRAGHHCCMPLHRRLGIAASCRISIAYYNEKKDIDRLVKGLEIVTKTFSI